MKQVVDKETAKADFEKFIDAIFCMPSEREQHADNEEKIIEQIQMGFVDIDEAGTPTIKLKVPLENHETVQIKTRMQVQDVINSQRVGTETEQATQMIAKITDLNNSKLVQKLATPDFKLLGLFLAYFL